MPILNADGAMLQGTNDRRRALEFLLLAYPSSVRHAIQDTDESAGLLLDMVSEGVILVRDPTLDPPNKRRIGYMAGPNWSPQRAVQVQEAAMHVHNLTESLRREELRRRAEMEEEKIQAAIHKRERRAARKVQP